MGKLPGMTGAFIMLGILCAVGGWAVIEGLIWIGSHINLGWIAMTTLNVAKLFRELPHRDVASAEVAVVFTLNGKTAHVESFSNSISSVASPQAMWGGMPISGPGIPAGATITAVGASTITLSANATATSTTTVVICPFGVGDGPTTFNVPDVRGRAPRGWDSGAGLDPGRVFGSLQADQFPVHTHTYGSATFITTVAGGGSTTVANWVAGNTGSAGGGSETRMKNIALLPCIKY
ncbi:hypothetical protein PS943_05847 [Pseudomonas fluorescens]|uniref:Phage tail collar domain-containing protein n=1 Tax=Pseudomonas fluorescens TaxID=294 RepID=A0A5E7WUA2_PSEFL|nr:hypothetical protein [Pseudomonas fluorescens]VVQ38404.1 hypothetical protein PS943_05847 [Pseudomonas fluorescens]